jgi:hypothetical protein
MRRYRHRNAFMTYDLRGMSLKPLRIESFSPYEYIEIYALLRIAAICRRFSSSITWFSSWNMYRGQGPLYSGII